MKKGFTVVELLIVIAIIVILMMLMFGSMKGCSGGSYYTTQNTGMYRCVKTYTHVSGGGDIGTTTSKRVDLAPLEGAVVTMSCDDDWQAGIHNSATLYAQFQEDHWYEINSIGFRQEGLISYFPLVQSVKEIPDPTQ